MTRCAGCDAPGAPVCTTCRFALVGRVAPTPAPRCPCRRAVHRSGARRGARAEVPQPAPRRPAPRRPRRQPDRRTRRSHAGRRRHVGAHQPRPAPGTRLRPGRTAGPPHRRPARACPCGGCSIATSDGGPQTGRTRRERLAGSVFRARPDVRDRWVLVVDDVVTTGATMTHAAHALEAAGAADGAALRGGVHAGRGRPNAASRPSPDRGRTCAAPVTAAPITTAMGLPIGSIAAWASSIASSAPEKARRSRPSKASFPTSTRWVRRFEALCDDALKAKTQRVPPAARQR